MSQANINLVHQILKSRKLPVSKSFLLDRLGCSDSTLKRIFRALRDDYNAPLDYDPNLNGYFYSDSKFELTTPSLWSSPETLMALISIQKLLEQMKVDILDKNLSILKQDIQHQLSRKNIPTNQVHRVRILPITARVSSGEIFQLIASALLQRKSLKINYYSRSNNKCSERVVSPQRLAYYKDNWYLDAWCHLKNQIRTFSVDSIIEVQFDQTICIDVDEDQLDTMLASSYGIFSGLAMHSAKLIFSAQRARWVSSEIWHPKQISTWLADGRYQLIIPYSDARELIMDIQRHLPEVEIHSPPELKQALLQHLQQAIQQHEKSEKK